MGRTARNAPSGRARRRSDKGLISGPRQTPWSGVGPGVAHPPPPATVIPPEEVTPDVARTKDSPARRAPRDDGPRGRRGGAGPRGLPGNGRRERDRVLVQLHQDQRHLPDRRCSTPPSPATATSGSPRPATAAPSSRGPTCWRGPRPIGATTSTRHGDHYYYPGGGQYAGFREDAGLCSGARIVYSKDIAAARAGRQSNLVIMSTCHLGETKTTMPGAFGIPKVKAGIGRVGRSQLLPRVPGRGVGQRRVRLRDPLLERARARLRGRAGVRRREARLVQRGVRRQLVRQLRLEWAGRAPADSLPQVFVR